MQIILEFDLELTNQFHKVNTFFWKVIEFIGFDWSLEGHKVKWFACGGMQLEQLMSHYITSTAVATVTKYDQDNFIYAVFFQTKGVVVVKY